MCIALSEVAYSVAKGEGTIYGGKDLFRSLTRSSLCRRKKKKLHLSRRHQLPRNPVTAAVRGHDAAAAAVRKTVLVATLQQFGVFVRYL